MAKTYLGQDIDVSAIMQQQGGNVAIGNMKVNGRGDVIDSKGNVIKTADQRAREHYKSTQVKTETTSLKPEVVEEEAVVQESPIAVKKPAKKARTEVVDDEGNISFEE